MHFPLFIFKGNWLPFRTYVRDGELVPEKALSLRPMGSLAATREENGGIDTAMFPDLGYSFVEHVEPLTRDRRKVELIYDWYRAQLSLPIPEIHERRNIIFTYYKHRPQARCNRLMLSRFLF